MSTIESITKSLALTKSLQVASILIGEPYTGKLTLIRSVFPEAVYVDARHLNEVENALINNEEIVIYNFEAIININKLNLKNRRIIAIANTIKDMKSIETHFAFIYMMPPLRERSEEVKALTKTLSEQMHLDLMLEKTIHVDYKSLDLTQNFKSFKISLYKELIKKSLTLQDIESVLFDFFIENLKGKNGYRDYIHIFEKPLIQAGLKKYKSQLQLADVLGLNRNTLRKKIKELNLD